MLLDCVLEPKSSSSTYTLVDYPSTPVISPSTPVVVVSEILSSSTPVVAVDEVLFEGRFYLYTRTSAL